MMMDYEVGDVVKIIWIDIGANHEFCPIVKINDLIADMRKDFTMTTYGEIVYLKDNEIAVTYTRTKKDIRLIYLRKELIESIEVLIPRQSL